MAKNVKEAVAEKIEIVDQPEDTTEDNKFNLWLISLVVLAAATVTFFLIRVFLKKD